MIVYILFLTFQGLSPSATAEHVIIDNISTVDECKRLSTDFEVAGAHGICLPVEKAPR